MNEPSGLPKPDFSNLSEPYQKSKDPPPLIIDRVIMIEEEPHNIPKFELFIIDLINEMK